MYASTDLTLRPLDEAAARDIVTWRYPPPYDRYNFDPTSAKQDVQNLLRPGYHYYGVWRDGELVGFRCFGEDARVPGGNYCNGPGEVVLDMGGGLRPDWTGRGVGVAFMQAAFAFAREAFAPTHFRATVAAQNRRARRVCERVGYRRQSAFTHPTTDAAFVILTREA